MLFQEAVSFSDTPYVEDVATPTPFCDAYRKVKVGVWVYQQRAFGLVLLYVHRGELAY